MTRLVIFDLDGTLLNTLGDLAESCDYVLKKDGLPQHTFEEYCHFIGTGVTRLVERAIPENLRTPEKVIRLREEFVDYYYHHIAEHTTPYPGIPELLKALTDRKIKIAVASNKFQQGTEKLIRLFFPDTPFVAVCGQRENVPLKPDPRMILDILQIAGVRKEEVLYVGDSGIDMIAATEAKVCPVGVTWGFRSLNELIENQAVHIVNTPSEILEIC